MAHTSFSLAKHASSNICLFGQYNACCICQEKMCLPVNIEEAGLDQAAHSQFDLGLHYPNLLEDAISLDPHHLFADRIV